MTIFRKLRSRTKRDQLDRDLHSEMQHHVELLTADLVRQGTSTEEARMIALRRFGNSCSLREASRESWGFPSLESFLQDLRFGVRLLVRSPGFTIVALLTLALGIGANTAVFTAVNALLIRSLPFAQSERLVTVWGSWIPEGMYLAHRERSRTLELAGYGTEGLNLTRDGEATRVDGAAVSDNFFQILGGHTWLGRTFHLGETAPGVNRTVILSHTFWQQQFSSDASIIGRSITLDGVDRQVVGVMPPDFAFPDRKTDLWLPLNDTPSNIWGPVWVLTIGRLRPGATPRAALAELKTFIPQLLALCPWKMPTNWGSWANVVPLKESIVSGLRTKLLALLAAVAVVLLIACVNIANLLLARASGRQKEIAVRNALGAGRARLVRQLITESVLLSGLGGIVGLIIAPFGLRLLKTFITPDQLPIEVNLDWKVLAFVSAVALITGMLFGLAPALRAQRLDVEQALRAHARSSMTRERRRLSSSLVVAETAMAMVLAIAAGLLIRSLWQLSHEPTGFQPEALVTASITPSSTFCRSSDRCLAFYQSLLEAVRGTSGVQQAAFADIVPYGAIRNSIFAVEGSNQYTTQSPYQTQVFTVSPNYFRTLSIPLLTGRDFSNADNSKAPGVVIVSRALADRFWPGEDPIGKRLTPSWDGHWRTVIGVVGNVRPTGILPAWADATGGAVYFAHTQGIIIPATDLKILIRTAEPSRIAGLLPSLVRSVNSSIPIGHIETMQQVMDESIAAPRTNAWLFAFFSAIALLLGAVGIYSLISCSVTAQTQEIGIRMALGAKRSEVLRRVLLHGMTLAGIGVAIGSAAALGVMRLLHSLLYGVRSADPTTFISVAVLLMLVAVAACYLPARRAATIDPIRALRYE